MYLQLKQNTIFTNPDTGEVHEVLTGGIKLINIDVDSKRVNFLVKFYEDRELMQEGKRPEFQETFCIEDTEEKTDFTFFYARSTGQMLGIEMEMAMYDFILATPGFENFEKVN